LAGSLALNDMPTFFQPFPASSFDLHKTSEIAQQGTCLGRPIVVISNRRPSDKKEIVSEASISKPGCGWSPSSNPSPAIGYELSAVAMPLTDCSDLVAGISNDLPCPKHFVHMIEEV
jgi:hypothetical protein